MPVAKISARLKPDENISSLDGQELMNVARASRKSVNPFLCV